MKKVKTMVKTLVKEERSTFCSMYSTRVSQPSGASNNPSLTQLGLRKPFTILNHVDGSLLLP